MKKFWEVFWNVLKAFLGYAAFIAIVSLAIVVAPAVCIVTAIDSEIPLTEAFENYFKDMATEFYESFKE